MKNYNIKRYKHAFVPVFRFTFLKGTVSVECGVPQGTFLGPTPFYFLIFYINRGRVRRCLPHRLHNGCKTAPEGDEDEDGCQVQ